MTFESGIPIPAHRKGRAVTEIGREVRDMKVGDSKFFTNRAKCTSTKTMIYKLGGKVAMRAGIEDGIAGWRLWRVA